MKLKLFSTLQKMCCSQPWTRTSCCMNVLSPLQIDLRMENLCCCLLAQISMLCPCHHNRTVQPGVLLCRSTRLAMLCHLDENLAISMYVCVIRNTCCSVRPVNQSACRPRILYLWWWLQEEAFNFTHYNIIRQYMQVLLTRRQLCEPKSLLYYRLITT